MPPGSPQQSNRKGLPVWAIVLLVIGGLMVAGLGTCAVIVGAGVYWAKDNAEGWVEANAQGEKDGINYARGKTDKACAQEFLRRLTACDGDFDIGCIQAQNGFALGCFGSTGMPAGHCDGLDEFDFNRVAERQQQVCLTYAIQDDIQCGRLSNALTFVCMSLGSEPIALQPAQHPAIKQASPVPVPTEPAIRP